MATAEKWTIRKLLEWTEQFFKSKGMDSPRLDAQILLAHSMQCKKIDLYVRSEEEPDESVRGPFRELIKRRVEGCPVAYLVGYREFYQLSFQVSADVLIPRPETELLVIEALTLLKQKPQSECLELGTGSGNIAVSIAAQSKETKITTVDISPSALNIAQANAKKHQAGTSIQFILGDLFNPLPKDSAFDLIVSNPPYISEAEFKDLSADVQKFEPKLALVGGTDGLEFYRRIAAEAAKFLKPDGKLILEIGATQKETVSALLESHHWKIWKVIADGARLPRVIVAQLNAE